MPDGVEIRTAQAHEKWSYEPQIPKRHEKTGPQPEKSIYWSMWCDVEDIITRGDDAIITLDTSNFQFTLDSIRRGINRLGKILFEMGRINYSVYAQQMYIFEKVTDQDNSFEVISESYIQVRAIFPEK